MVAAGGVLLVALFHVVAGWVVSGGLHRGALAVQPRVKDIGVRVRRVSGDRITLESPLPRQDIGHPGTLGLVWPNGYGRVGDVLEARDSQIVRRFEQVHGSPPVCVGPLEGCLPVEMDGYVYPNDPSDVGLGFESITYDSPIGSFGAWLVPGGTGRRWAVHCHGWTAEKRELIRILPAFHERGFTSMVIDYRNDPGMPVDPSRRYRFGLSEWEDLEAAVRAAVDGGATEVVLIGCSTGAALVMAFLERSELASVVVGVVLDAPNIILAEAIRRGSQSSRATPLMIEFGMWIADLRWGIDWEATNYVQRARETLRVAALVFHGTSDHTVPISVSRQLEARVPELVQLVETPAAGHVMSWNADPARYTRYLDGFLADL
jgi:hypothetical protein